MKFPKKIKIGGHQVKIVFKKLENDLCGFSDFENNTIEIDSKLTTSMKELTFIHEIFHWINSEFHSKSTDSHALLESLSQQLYQVLKDNKFI